MFEVTVKVMGKSAQILEVSNGATIQQVQELMGLDGNYTYNLGGKPATKETLLSEGAYIVLAPSVKGAMAVKKVTAKPTQTTKKPATKLVKKK